MRKFLEKSTYIVVLILVFTAVISCEKDFTDIGSSIVSNTKFNTDTLTVREITIENSPVTSVTSDNLSIDPGQYLLGVHASDAYEKIEASIVSQLALSSGLQVVDDANVYASDTTVVTTIDTVFIKLPYQVVLNDDATAYVLDSIIGDQTKAFNLNVYQTSTYLSTLNPAEPSKFNSYQSNDVFEKTGSLLSATANFKFLPSLTDSIVVKRWLSTGALATKDTVTYLSSTSTLPLPFAAIPLNEAEIKKIFLDKYESSEFNTQAAFNNYFRGLILEASGDEGSLISFNFNGTVKPSLEVYYTNTVVTGGVAIDTIYKNDSFLLSGVRSSIYKMEDKTYPVDNIVVQGAAGSEAVIDLFGEDTNANGVADKIEELRERNLLINDASLTFYINESADVTALPYRLYLYKSNEDVANPVYSQIKDVYTEGITSFGGVLEKEIINEETVQKYTFKITDYISDILSDETDYSPKLRLKVINSTDLQTVTDTVFKNYNWNPKAVTLLNQSAINGAKRAEFKISYSEKKN
ncbi:DUF4270 family protein [Polaribacter butkevichii]|uniref:DUF4270 domain-containing protein n=1 Tax=Polaribacter butkevichii TaxID=218490 RepID=A0A2P6C7R6_9FLAO|nr:DUF4270 family protein [Polaribacter butkevichii]PQJ68942.1 hypothetical protein BTO14_12930 [Polaribacter butkevichii]